MLEAFNKALKVIGFFLCMFKVRAPIKAGFLDKSTLTLYQCSNSNAKNAQNEAKGSFNYRMIHTNKCDAN